MSATRLCSTKSIGEQRTTESFLYVYKLHCQRKYVTRHTSTDIGNLNSSNIYYLFFYGATAPSGPGPPHYRGFTITHNDAPQSVELLWTSGQPDAETSTCQHTKHTRNNHPCPRRVSNPQSKQAGGRRHAP